MRLLGHSLGGLAALEWALRFPEEVTQLVLLDPTPPAYPPYIKQDLLEILEVAARPLTGVLSLSAPFGVAMRRIGYTSTTTHADELPTDLAQHYFGTPANIQWLIRQWWASYPQQRRVGELIESGARLHPDLDILHLVGLTAEGFFARQQRRLAERLGSTIVELEGYGHLFPLSHPELVLRAISKH